MSEAETNRGWGLAEHSAQLTSDALHEEPVHVFFFLRAQALAIWALNQRTLNPRRPLTA
jgi:hypothetical protein